MIFKKHPFSSVLKTTRFGTTAHITEKHLKEHGKSLSHLIYDIKSGAIAIKKFATTIDRVIADNSKKLRPFIKELSAVSFCQIIDDELVAIGRISRGISRGIIYIFYDDSLSLIIKIVADNNEDRWGIHLGGVPEGTESDLTDKMIALINMVIYRQLFLEFAELEVVELEARSKKKINKSKFLNRSDFRVDFVDSSYFRTTIRSGEFEVEGHFRMQAYGKQLSKRRLKWINTYKKYGYTRVAKKTRL